MASRISPTRLARFFSTTNVAGHKLSCKVALGHRLRSVGDQDAQQIECFGRQVHRVVPAQQFPGFRVEHVTYRSARASRHSTLAPALDRAVA